MCNTFLNYFNSDVKQDIQISDEDLNTIEKWNENKAILFQIKSCIFQLAFNLKDYENFIRDYNDDKITCTIPETNENDYIAQQYNRLLLNFTSSYVACTEHYRKICKSYNLSENYKNLTLEYYNKFFEYRFFHQLRNLIFHNAVPTNIVKVTHKKLICTKNYILEQGEWNQDLKRDIQALPNELELNLYIKKAIMVLLDMLDIATYNIFNKGLDLYEPLKQFLLNIKIKNLDRDIVLRIEKSNDSFSTIYNFGKEYNFIKAIADNQKYASWLFKLYIENS